jgi:hypothetical protein
MASDVAYMRPLFKRREAKGRICGQNALPFEKLKSLTGEKKDRRFIGPSPTFGDQPRRFELLETFLRRFPLAVEVQSGRYILT